MHTALFAILSLATSAHAQQPLTLNLEADASTKTMYVLEDTESKRFPDAEQAGKSFIAGDRVQVVSKTADMVRVMKGNTFGWVPRAVLSEEAPAPEPVVEAAPAEGSN